MHATGTSQASTLMGTAWPAAGQAGKAARLAILALLGSLLLTASAKMQVPFWPVPMTMQTLVVMLLGMAYGWRLGAATVLLYLAEGALGLPVFAGTPERGIGLAYMAGPTGGYLIGFVASALVVGWLAERGWDRSVLRTATCMAIGHAVIFAFGVAWLAALVGLPKAVALGLAPFWLATLLKIALGAVIMPLAWRAAAALTAR